MEWLKSSPSAFTMTIDKLEACFLLIAILPHLSFATSITLPNQLSTSTSSPIITAPAIHITNTLATISPRDSLDLSTYMNHLIQDPKVQSAERVYNSAKISADHRASGIPDWWDNVDINTASLNWSLSADVKNMIKSIDDERARLLEFPATSRGTNPSLASTGRSDGMR